MLAGRGKRLDEVVTGPASRDVKGMVKSFLQQTEGIEGSLLLVGLSGGKDSVCLLHVLYELREELGFDLAAIHVEHGIRETSREDARFCEVLCESLQIPCAVRHVNAPEKAKAEGISLEDAARRLRYEAFEEEADRLGFSFDKIKEKENIARDESSIGTEPIIEVKEENKGEKEAREAREVFLLTAHHALDQAETVLMHLLRGSGLKGLGGIRERRGHILRPLLRVMPEQIEVYLEEKGLPHAEDETNGDLTYTRNRIRHSLIPLLETQYNPALVKDLVRTAFLLQEDEDLLQQLTESEEKPGCSFDLTGFAQMHPALQRRKIRSFLEANGALKDLEETHVRALVDLALGPVGRRLSLPRGLTVSRSYDILFFNFFAPTQKEVTSGEGFHSEILPVCEVRNRYPEGIPGTAAEVWMDADRAGEDLTWRTRREGDYLMILRRSAVKEGTEEESAGERLGKQKLQDLFINKKIPREERPRTRLLASGSRILWIPGVRMSDDVKIGPDTERVLHIYREKE